MAKGKSGGGAKAKAEKGQRRDKEKTKKLPCQCDHEWQDSVYGKGIRLMNLVAGDKGYRCTVCAKVR